MPSDREAAVGQRFREFRQQKGLSQNDLAEGICSFSAVSHLENGRRILFAPTMGKLAERLGVPLREIMGDDEKSLDHSYQIEIIRVYVTKGDFKHALALMDQLDQDKLLLHQKQEVLIFRAECLTKTGQPESAIQSLQAFIEEQAAQQSVDDEMLCEAYSRLGTAHYYAKDFQKAFSAYEQGYHISLRFESFKKVAAIVSLNLGICCNQLGMRDDAHRYLDKARSYFAEHTDLRKLADSLFSLAIATKSKEYISQALHLYDSLNDLRNAFLARQYHVYHFHEENEYVDATKELHHLAEQFEKQLDDVDMAIYLFGRAFMIGYTNNDFALAEQSLAEAEKRVEMTANQESHRIAYLERCKAIYNLAENKYEQAVQHALKSSQLYVKMGMVSESADSLQLSAESYSRQGLFKEAYEILKSVNGALRKNGRESDE